MKHLTELNRRNLLKGAAVGGAVVASGMTPAIFSKAQAATPKKGGKLRVGMGHGSTSDNYDPGVWENAYAQVFATARNCYLTEVTAEGDLIGEAATEWSVSGNGLTYEFKLRDGVMFHSGKTLDADDVVASINYHRGEDSKSAAKPIVEPIQSIRASGKLSVVMVIKESNADFPFMLSDYHLPVLPAKDGKIDPKSADGCGAYQVVSYDPGVSATMIRNPNYWKDNRAHFDEIEMLTIADASARLNAVISGEVDVIDRVDLSTINMLKRRNNINILSTTGTQHYTFPMDTRIAPYNDNNVRMALKYAIDRQEMVDKVLNGYGSVGNDHPIGPSQRFHHKDLEQRSFDADKAKYYMKQAGLDRLELTLSVADAAFPGAVDAGVLYSETAAASGIELTINREPNDGYWNNVWMKKPFCACYWGGRPTEDWMFSTAYSGDAAWNDSFWSHDRFNKLLVQARSESNMENRRELYYDMQEIVSNQGGVVVPMFASYVMALSDKIAHPETVGANWAMDGFRALERWWFA